MIYLEDRVVLSVFVQPPFKFAVQIIRGVAHSSAFNSVSASSLVLKENVLVDMPKHKKEADVLAPSELTSNEGVCCLRVMYLVMDPFRLCPQELGDGFGQVRVGRGPESCVVITASRTRQTRMIRSNSDLLEHERRVSVSLFRVCVPT